MDMKWHPIVNGDMSRVPRDEELLFTVFDEEDGETYVTSCWTDEEGYDGNLVARTGATYFGTECLTAWMELPLPYKPKNKCFSCTHLVDWMDEFGDRWLECELLNVPFKKINPGECPLKKDV